MVRYEDVTPEVEKLVKEIINEDFPELRAAKIKVLFDLKKRKSRWKLVLARIQKPNDIVKYFTIDESGREDGYDYIMYIDKKCWGISDEEDQRRLIRHELQHCDVDEESINNPYKLKDHDFTDFIEEVERNRDNPNWNNILAERTMSVYEEND
jgi:hypothetical protein